MNRQGFAVLGVSVLSAGLALAVTACSPSNSADAGPAATHAGVAASPAQSTPAAQPPAVAVTHSAPVATPSSAPAATPPLTTSAAAPHTPTAAPSGAPIGPSPYVLWDCAGHAQVRPSAFILACADDGLGLTGMHWTSWAPEYGAGSGTAYENDCQPNCAEGKIIDYPVNVTLTGSVLLDNNGPSYTRITLHYPDAAPPVYSTVNGKTTVTHPSTFSMRLTGRPAS